MPGSGRSPFLHKELHFQRKAPAPSTGGASSSLRLKRGLEECRAFPAAITLSYSDTDDSSCWEQALFPSLCSALCTSQSLFHPVPFRQRPASISCCQLGSAGLLSFPRTGRVRGQGLTEPPRRFPGPQSGTELGKGSGKRDNFLLAVHPPGPAGHRGSGVVWVRNAGP